MKLWFSNILHNVLPFTVLLPTVKNIYIQWKYTYNLNSLVEIEVINFVCGPHTSSWMGFIFLLSKDSIHAIPMLLLILTMSSIMSIVFILYLVCLCFRFCMQLKVGLRLMLHFSSDYVAVASIYKFC